MQTNKYDRCEAGTGIDSQETDNQYYAIKEFITLTYHPTTSIMHINIRHIAKDKSKLFEIFRR